MTAREIFQAVYDRFDGNVPTIRCEVDLATIVIVVLEVLADNDIVEVDIRGLIAELMEEVDA